MLSGALALAVAPLAASAADERMARPRAGDVLVFSEGGRKGEVIDLSMLKAGEQPVFAFPMEPQSKTVRDGSRLNQVLVVRLEAADIDAKTQPHTVEGVVAYSAICTHYGCQVTLFKNQRTVVCNCHGSTFDAGNNGEILGGPASRRLAILPLKAADGVLTVAAGFSGRLGPPQQ